MWILPAKNLQKESLVGRLVPQDPRSKSFQVSSTGHLDEQKMMFFGKLILIIIMIIIDFPKMVVNLNGG
jgi:hypothetical protein